MNYKIEFIGTQEECKLITAFIKQALKKDIFPVFTGEIENGVVFSLEGSLLDEYFEQPSSATDFEYMTTSEIKLTIEVWSGKKISLNKLGQELRKRRYLIGSFRLPNQLHSIKGYQIKRKIKEFKLPNE